MKHADFPAQLLNYSNPPKSLRRKLISKSERMCDNLNMRAKLIEYWRWNRTKKIVSRKW